MEKLVDCRLLMIAAEVARQWQSEDSKEFIRNDFAKFAKPFWLAHGGEDLVNYMMNKYVNNDEQSIVEYIYNLDNNNREIVAKYLLSKVKGHREDAWTISIDV